MSHMARNLEVHFPSQMALTCWSTQILWAPPLHGLTMPAAAASSLVSMVRRQHANNKDIKVIKGCLSHLELFLTS